MSNNSQTDTNGAAQAPIPDDELERVLELTELDLDYTELQDSLKDLSKLAAHVAGTDISLVNLIDTYTQWSVSNYGIDMDQIPREDTVCQYTILDKEHLEIKNLTNDDRFDISIYGESNSNLEYYFGIPLTTPNGHHIGTLCVMDTEARNLTPEKVELLKIIAKEIVKRLESIHKISDLKSTLNDISEMPRKMLHDIRGPVGGIIGLAEIIRDEAEEKDLDDIIELIELINKGGKSVLELADDILSQHSNEEEQDDKPRDYEFNLVILQNKLQQLFKPQAKSKGVNFAVNIEGDNQELPFPKQKMMQIIGNLISNAIKFTPEDGDVLVNMSLKQKSGDSSQSHNLHITVEDTGTGMPPEQIEAIRNADGDALSTEGTGGEKGFGFGTRLVKHLVLTLDGQLRLESTEGQGTTIEVTIPLNL